MFLEKPQKPHVMMTGQMKQQERGSGVLDQTQTEIFGQVVASHSPHLCEHALKQTMI